MRFPRAFSSVACIATIALAVSALRAQSDNPGTTAYHSYLWGQHGERWDPAGRLPDFSFAGYRFGEEELPRVSVTANVRDFGAKGDGVTDDTKAFQDAIARAKPGAILIPAGRYVITDILWLRRPGIVLRGAGRDETTLVCPRPLEEIKPNTGATTTGRPTSNYSWSGGIVWVQGDSKDTREPRPVTTAAKRGDRRLPLAHAKSLRVGERVCLDLTDDPARTLVAHLYAGDPGETDKLGKAVTTRLVSRIAAIEGNVITLERTLPFDVRPEWQPRLALYTPTVSEVGIEDLGFEFPLQPYNGHFTEPGHNAIAIQHASDCWVRNVRIHNADSGIFLRSMFCTLDGILIDTARPPHARDGATGHHGLDMGIDCLAQNFEFRTHFIHDITFDHAACRNVVKNGRGVNLSLDHHKRVPYANLLSNLDAGDGSALWVCGGGAALGKHCAAWGTFWNIRTTKPVRSPDKNFAPDLINLVGLHFHPDEKRQTAPATGRWVEPIPAGHQLFPADLHAAQLARRLGR